MDERKGQINIFTQPIMLIILISIFALFVIKTLEVNVDIAKETEEYSFKLKAEPIFDRVVSCISHEYSRYPYVVSSERLDALSKDFADGDAPCVRDDTAGWDAVVTDVYSRTPKSWRFGESGGSSGMALEREFSITMPVAIRYEDGSVNAGELSLNLKQGDLESVVGRMETVYRTGSQTRKSMRAAMSLRVDYPIVPDFSEGKKRICAKADDGSTCKTLSFTNVEFEPLDAGMHYIVFTYDYSKDKLSVSG